MDITYFYNSGFAVKHNDTLLVFDYYVDSEKCLAKLIKDAREVYFFVSHWHGDHYSPRIFDYQDRTSAYILSSDVAVYIPNDIHAEIVWVDPYQEHHLNGVIVRTYGSTDEGVSFDVWIGDWHIFHAGDLNWWHWKEDTEENKQAARDLFVREMQYLAGQTFDIVFFPVDGRLEEYKTWGIQEFCRQTNVSQAIAMHLHQAYWDDKDGLLKKEGRPTRVWCPRKQGETIHLEK